MEGKGIKKSICFESENQCLGPSDSVLSPGERCGRD